MDTWITSGIAIIMGAAAAGLSLPLLTSLVKPDALPVDGGARRLAYGWPLKALVVGFWGFWLLLVAVLLLLKPFTPLLATAVAAGFLVPIVFLHIEFFGVRVHLEEGGLLVRSPWRFWQGPRREVVIPWDAVKQVRYSAGMQWYVVETEGYGRVRLHIFLDGLDSLLLALRRRWVTIDGSHRAAP